MWQSDIRMAEEEADKRLKRTRENEARDIESPEHT